MSVTDAFLSPRMRGDATNGKIHFYQATRVPSDQTVLLLIFVSNLAGWLPFVSSYRRFVARSGGLTGDLNRLIGFRNQIALSGLN